MGVGRLVDRGPDMGWLRRLIEDLQHHPDV
jgi:hypothetical protein